MIRTARTGRDGIARFLGVPHGSYAARLEEPPSETIPLESRPDETTEISIDTAVPGPPLPRGTIHVTVREHSIDIAGSVEVWLTHAAVKGDTTKHGKLAFEGIVYGDYIIEAEDAEPVAVTLDGASATATVFLRPPKGTLRVTVTSHGTPVARREVEVIAKTGEVASALTDAEGLATLELRQGRYEVRLGDHARTIYVKGNHDTPCSLKLSEKALPDEDGTLAVSVLHEDGSPAVTAMVRVSGDGVLEADYPNASGVAAFALPPGDYTIEVDERSAAATVYAASTKWVQLEVSG